MSFTYYRSLTIDHTQCGGSDSSSFPVLVFGSDASLKDAAHGGHVQSSAGSDVLFFADAMGSTQYASEIEFYDNVNGILWAWVQVPTVSHSANITFYVLYGNASPPARTPNPWDSNYKCVYHMQEASGSIVDSIAGAHGTAHGSPSYSQSGQINKSISVASGVYFSASDSSFPSVNGQFSSSVWINSTSATAFPTFMQYGTTTTNNGRGMTENTGKFWPGWVGTDYSSGITVSDGNWHLCVWTFDGSLWRTYVDGAAGATLSHTANTVLSELDIGSCPGQPSNWIGRIQETRVSNIARSADWITTEYNNQNSPGNIGTPGFLTWGSEQLSLLVEDKITPGSITSRIDSGDIHFGGM